MGATLASMDGSVVSAGLLAAKSTSVQSQMTQIGMAVSAVQAALSAVKNAANPIH
jgi:hypothetical protein